jgi:hypothetical protein
LNDRVLGSGNMVLPLYINKYHWKISKEYIPIILGMMITNNISLYSQHMDNIYYSVLFEFTKNMFLQENIKWSQSWIQTWISIFRTCFQISFDKRYHKGFVKYMDKLNNQKLGNKYNIMLGQIISTGYNDINIVNKIFIDHVKKLVMTYLNESGNAEYKNLFIIMVTTDDSQLQQELIHIYNRMNVNEIFDNYIGVIFGMELIIFLKKSNKGILNFVKEIDNHYGVIEGVNNIFNFCNELRNGLIHTKSIEKYLDKKIPFNVYDMKKCFSEMYQKN